MIDGSTAAGTSDGANDNGVNDDGFRDITRDPNDGTGAEGSAGPARKEAALIT